MISTDIKSNIKQQEIKDPVAVSHKLLCNEQRVCIFNLILDGISSILILSVKNRGVG